MKLNKKSRIAFALLTGLLTTLFVIEPSFANLDSSLLNLKTNLTTIVLPTLSVIGIGFAAVSFFTGNPQAKTHILYAVLGCVFGFGSQGISDFIRGIMH